MKGQFITDCESYIKNEGYPYTAVSKKTGIKYNRLRNLRSGAVEPTLPEFIALGRFCKLDYNIYLFEGEPQAG